MRPGSNVIYVQKISRSAPAYTRIAVPAMRSKPAGIVPFATQSGRWMRPGAARVCHGEMIDLHTTSEFLGSGRGKLRNQPKPGGHPSNASQ